MIYFCNEALVAGTIMSIKEKKTSKGTPFAIIKFSDLESEFELFLFSDLLIQKRNQLKAASSFSTKRALAWCGQSHVLERKRRRRGKHCWRCYDGHGHVALVTRTLQNGKWQ